MDFLIVDLISSDLAVSWLTNHFHPDGLKCPHCGTDVKKAREFRRTTRSCLVVYRCCNCDGVYNLYSGTVFEGSYLSPSQVILLLRGVCKGETSAQIAREIRITRQTVLKIRRALQDRALAIQPNSPLPDEQTETDEMFQNAGEKRNSPSEFSRSTKAEGKQKKGTRDDGK